MTSVVSNVVMRLIKGHMRGFQNLIMPKCCKHQVFNANYVIAQNNSYALLHSKQTVLHYFHGGFIKYVSQSQTRPPLMGSLAQPVQLANVLLISIV